MTLNLLADLPETSSDQLSPIDFQLALAASTPRTFVTPALIAINIIVFVAMALTSASLLDPTAATITKWGGTFGPLVTHGQPWRLLTAMFVHVGLVHLLMNMYVLLAIGMFAERLFGNGPFLLLYLLAGMAGSVASVAAHPMTVGAGASGAIFGIYGGLIGFLIVHRNVVPVEMLGGMIRNAIIFVGANLLIGFTKPNVDLAAHVGGFLGGIPIGAALVGPLAGDAGRRLSRAAAIAAAGLIAMTAVVFALPSVDDLAAAVKRIADLESSLAKRYNASSGTVDRDILAPWNNERAKLLALRLPKDQQAQAAKVAAYMALKADSWRQMASGERAVDPQLIGALPDGVIGQAQARRAGIEAYTTEMRRISDMEKRNAATFRLALDQLRSRTLEPDAFASRVEQDMVKPWNVELKTLQAMRVPDDGIDQRRKIIVRYMTIRRDAWRLTARGFAQNDLALVKEANAKQEEAAGIVRELNASADAPRKR